MSAGMLRADLHNHTHFSPDSILAPDDLVRRCVRAGITCVAVTDHNTVRGGLEAQRIVEEEGIEGLRVIVGEEVRTAEGEILGLFLSKDVPKGMTAEQTIVAIRAQGGIVGVPHPFDSLRSALEYGRLKALVKQIDFIESYNARIVFRHHNKRAGRFASMHNLPVSAASDAHSPWEVGRAYIDIPEFDGPKDFVKALDRGMIGGTISSPLVHMVSRYAVLKRAFGWSPPE